MSTSEDLYPLAVLIDDLKSEDIATRINSVKRVTTIALALGPERTRDELLPFLEDDAREDEDEILVVLAEELAKFVPLVGGPGNAHLLIGPLSILAACEEPTVRDAAVASLTSIAAEIPEGQLEEHFIGLIKRLSASDWFSSRMAATGLYVAAVRGLPQSSKELLSSLRELASDDAPMVRRAAATALPDVIAELEKQRKDVPPQDENDIKQLLTEMFMQLASDDQDSVRLLSVNTDIALATHLPAVWNEELLNRTFQLLDDKSWRVRYMAADHFGDLARAAGAENIEKMDQIFVQLTKDPESEVRTAISRQAVSFCELLSVSAILNDVVPCLEALTEDSSEHVREALASQISYLSPKIGKEMTIEHLRPLFLQMLKDEHSEVRLALISNLQVINEVIGIDLLSQSLLPAISDLAKDKQWRVLLAIIDYSPLLAEQLGVEFFNKELVPLVIQWMWDPVWAIRDAAAKNLTKLADVFGVEWLESEILPKIVVMNPNANYLYRLTSLLAVKTIVPILGRKALEERVMPFVVTLSEDPVPNIRFNCAKTFAELAAALKNTNPAIVSGTILPALEKHQEDMDSDVRFFVNEALNSIRGTPAENASPSLDTTTIEAAV